MLFGYKSGDEYKKIMSYRLYDFHKQVTLLRFATVPQLSPKKKEMK